MISQQFQETYARISDIGNNLLEYLREFRREKLAAGDDTQGLQSVDQTIVNALNALKEQKYEVAVVAPMKAGKSTFLNAIIGADILASESAACTICRTDVRHIESVKTPRLLEYRQGYPNPKTLVEGSAGEIQEKFLERTREIRNNSSTNKEIPIRFEVQYPIEAIGNLPSLSGFTLIDTPGPNEWKSMSVDMIALKQASLEALRTCKAVLFILNYRSFKDNAINELFQSITENRQELLADSKSRIYFILNQVDLKSEKDPEISETVESLKQDLIKFGFPEPEVYPVSSLQGLLAKLIQQSKATDNQIKDFKKFFSAQYREENEDGDMIIPAPRKIALQAVQDSGILAIQEAVFLTIVQTAGWNLLSDVLNQLDKASKAIEDTLNTQVAGWQMEIEDLRKKVEEYSEKRASARDKINTVRGAMDEQTGRLIEGFSAGIDAFVAAATEKLQQQIDGISTLQSSNEKKFLLREQSMNFSENDGHPLKLFFRLGTDIGTALLGLVPQVGKELANLFKVGISLADHLATESPNSLKSDSEENLPPHSIRFSTESDAQNFAATINSFCAPLILSWWTDIQDRLILEGTSIREEVLEKIQSEIQEISDELSRYLGNALQVEININPIQFPQFEFQGIDEQIVSQQAVYYRATEKQKRTEGRCCASDRTYEVDVEIQKEKAIYVVDLTETVKRIEDKIKEQAANNKKLLVDVVKKQVRGDFKNAEDQVSDYMEKFELELNRLLLERDKKQSEAPQIIESLEAYIGKLDERLKMISEARANLDEWKPV